MKIRYCDGASFAGNSIFDNGVNIIQSSPSFQTEVFSKSNDMYLEYTNNTTSFTMVQSLYVAFHSLLSVCGNNFFSFFLK